MGGRSKITYARQAGHMGAEVAQSGALGGGVLPPGPSWAVIGGEVGDAGGGGDAALSQNHHFQGNNHHFQGKNRHFQGKNHHFPLKGHHFYMNTHILVHPVEQEIREDLADRANAEHRVAVALRTAAAARRRAVTVAQKDAVAVPAQAANGGE